MRLVSISTRGRAGFSLLRQFSPSHLACKRPRTLLLEPLRPSRALSEMETALIRWTLPEAAQPTRVARPLHFAYDGHVEAEKDHCGCHEKARDDHQPEIGSVNLRDGLFCQTILRGKSSAGAAAGLLSGYRRGR